MDDEKKINPELQKALDKLSTDLKGKTETEVKALNDTFAKENKKIVDKQIADEVKTANETLETSLKKDFDDKLKIKQDHLDKLDIKLQAKVAKDEAPKDELKAIIVDNFDEIKEVRKGKGFSIETKAVANMTLSTALTNDAPRTYAAQVVMDTGQLVNVADLLGAPINISGGTYTYPFESGGEGTITTQTEGSDKAQVDFDLTMTDIATDFIAGFVVFSKKMVNNLPFLESFIPQALRRNYWTAENTVFNTALASAATASVEIITSKNKIEMLINEIGTLEAANEAPTAIAMRPADFYSILKIEKSTGAGYGLPPGITFENGQMRIIGLPVFRVNWPAANKYYVGNWSLVKKIVTSGLTVEFSEHDEDNFRKNNISARVEAQVGIGLLRATALVYGDFTAT